MQLFDRIVDFVDARFSKLEIEHFRRTLYWYEKFLPTLSEAHRIAAYSHDIERAFRRAESLPDDHLSRRFLKLHQETGAKIMADLLRDLGAPEETILKVSELIPAHEVGGSDDQNALMDADSVSFFETNAEHFVMNKVAVDGSSKIRSKLDWMFSRIKSPKARKLAKSKYEHWIRILEAKFRSMPVTSLENVPAE